MSRLTNETFNNETSNQTNIKSTFLKALSDCKKLCGQKASVKAQYEALIACLNHVLNLSSHCLNAKDKQDELLIDSQQLNNILKWLKQLQHLFNQVRRHSDGGLLAEEYLNKYKFLKNAIHKVQSSLAEKLVANREIVNTEGKLNQYKMCISEIKQKQTHLEQFRKEIKEQKKAYWLR